MSPASQQKRMDVVHSLLVGDEETSIDVRLREGGTATFTIATDLLRGLGQLFIKASDTAKAAAEAQELGVARVSGRFGKGLERDQ
ncbi:hypothetical protein A5N78_04745 [Prescottella equi]|uniref:hypothetical protein n=1 Tax=Rhodococcus hoagii TaxID=43767 RepID=UPI000A0F740F|nr:hypothetical protein [Prescottella equi]ORL93447.1 hypothetical protein A5N78_04745 [Prescottella equi]ORM17800.1 hypothetical protein A5N70_11320 [Prescottella equi]